MDWSVNPRESSLSTSPVLGLQEDHHARLFTVSTGVVCQIKVPVLTKQVLYKYFMGYTLFQVHSVPNFLPVFFLSCVNTVCYMCKP